MAKPQLELDIQFALKTAGMPRRRDFRRWAKAALQTNASVVLRVADKAEARKLNREFRGKDYATNVLTFAYGSDVQGDPLSGDILICAPVVVREAKKQGITLEAHYAHLTVHGMLHLQGFDHETDGEAVIMESIESFIMQKLGFADPYSVPQPVNS